MTERKRRYDQLKETIQKETSDEKPTMSVRHLKTSFVANGSWTPEEFEGALGALQQNDVIVRGSGWVTPVLDDQWLRESVEYVIERESDPQGFVASVNTVTHD